jgi:hypothetical protein
MSKVFVSYSEPDVVLATRLVGELKLRNFDLWFAPAELMASDRLDDIFMNIRNADFFIIVISARSVNSPWVNKELSVAVARQLSGYPLRILPIRIDTAELPAAISDLIAIDLREPNWVRGILEVKAALQGKYVESSSALKKFEEFINTLTVVPDKIEDFFEKMSRVVGISYSD